MIKLNNGATPIVWQVRHGCHGERPYLGHVVARCGGLHPYVVWMLCSDDGVKWDCVHGDYYKMIGEAVDRFNERASDGAIDASINEKLTKEGVIFA